jgi:hypothetical protein
MSNDNLEIDVNEYKVSGRSEAIDSINDRGKDEYEGRYEPNRTWDTNISGVKKNKDGEYYRKVKIIYQTSPKINIRIPKWENMSTWENKKMEEYLEAVKNHEIGHNKIENRNYKGSETIKVKSSNKSGLNDKVENEVERTVKERMSKANNARDEYDDVTNHGLSQGEGPENGFPGGPNTDISFEHPEGKNVADHVQDSAEKLSTDLGSADAGTADPGSADDSGLDELDTDSGNTDGIGSGDTDMGTDLEAGNPANDMDR